MIIASAGETIEGIAEGKDNGGVQLQQQKLARLSLLSPSLDHTSSRDSSDSSSFPLDDLVLPPEWRSMAADIVELLDPTGGGRPAVPEPPEDVAESVVASSSVEGGQRKDSADWRCLVLRRAHGHSTSFGPP